MSLLVTKMHTNQGQRFHMEVLHHYPFDVTDEKAKEMFCHYMNISESQVTTLETEEGFLYFYLDGDVLYQAVIPQED